MVQKESDWRAAYTAGAFDWGGRLRAGVKKSKSAKFGYAVTFEVTFEKVSPEAVGLIDEFCEDLRLDHKANAYDRDDGSTRYCVRLTRRDDVREFLEAVAPFVVARYEQVVILLEDVFPALQEGLHRKSPEGFVEVVSMIDRLHERNFQRGSHKKYSSESIADELGVDIR